MGRGVPTLEEGAEGGTERAERSEVCTSAARKIGEAPCAARPGQSPLAQGLSTVLDREADVYRVGVAGGKGPLRWVAEDQRAGDREEPSSL